MKEVLAVILGVLILYRLYVKYVRIKITLRERKEKRK